MKKPKTRHIWRKLKKNSLLYLFMGFLLTGAVFISTNRENNLEMIRLRANVFLVDEAGGDIETALRDLREHVHSHMNTGLTDSSTSIYPPIQLKYRYERLVKVESDRVSALNEQIYTDAQTYCEKQFPVGLSGSGRIPCIEAYVSQRGEKAQPIIKELYQFDFVSPTWSPDKAGWSLLIAIIFTIAFITGVAMDVWAQFYRNKHS